MKRLFYDIEVSPNVGFFWQSGHQISVGYDSIIKEREIICICYKWEGRKTVHSITWDEKQSDKSLLKKFAPILMEADEIVGHNGDKFDLKWIRTRCIKHKIKLTPYFKSIDTLKQARSLFKFNSNRLDYIGDYLEHGKKINTSYDLWKKIILNKDKKALKEMVDYCKRDVELLENVFESMNSYIKPKSNIAQYRHECPECGSDNTGVSKYRTSAAGVKTVQVHCNDCGKYNSVPLKTYEKEKRLKAIKDKKK